MGRNKASSRYYGARIRNMRNKNNAYKKRRDLIYDLYK